jgi:hypothetical protein
MCASWVKKYDPNLLVNRLGELRHIDSNGRVSFEGMFIDNILSVLLSAVDLGVDLPEIEKNEIIHQAVFAPAVPKDYNTKHLLAEISRRTANYLNRTQKKFCLIASLSFRYSPVFRNKRLASASFSFLKSLPQKFDRSPFKERIEMLDGDSVEGQYTTVITSIHGRSPTEAVSRGFDCLDLLRGIWNLYLNMGSPMRMSFGEKEPVNQIRLSKIKTLHTPDGKLASDFFWYDTDFVAPRTIIDLTGKWKKLQKFEQRVRKRLRQTNNANFISDAIRRYTRALDEKKLDNSFLKLWSVLELLTGTTGDSYKRTIDRVIFRYQKPEWERQTLEHLRDHRNKAIHHMESTQQQETIVYQLKRYVENLLVFHLNSSKYFSSLDECWQFLDMPLNRSEAQKKLKLARMTLKLIDRRENK